MYGTAMKYCFRDNSHDYRCIVAPVNGFSSANLTGIAIYIVWTSYSYHWDGPGVSYGYSIGIASGLCHIIAISCICIHLGAISKDNKVDSRPTQQIGALKSI